MTFKDGWPSSCSICKTHSFLSHSIFIFSFPPFSFISLPSLSVPFLFLFRSASVYCDSAPLSRVTWSLDCHSSSLPGIIRPPLHPALYDLFFTQGVLPSTWPRPCYSSVPLLPVFSSHTEQSVALTMAHKALCELFSGELSDPAS